VNRLEDSIILWKNVVSNKLLANVNIVLFLNKCDLLQRKLAAGVRLAHYMTSYGDRANDFDSVSKCASGAARCIPVPVANRRHRADLRNKFGALHQTYTPNKERELYSACCALACSLACLPQAAVHMTAVVDSRRTSTLINQGTRVPRPPARAPPLTDARAPPQSATSSSRRTCGNRTLSDRAPIPSFSGSRPPTFLAEPLRALSRSSCVPSARPHSPSFLFAPPRFASCSGRGT
jgi:hypothetical protein